MTASNTDLELILRQELFTNFPQEKIDFIISNSQRLSLSKNTKLFSTGEKAACFFMLISGEIRVFMRNDEGGEHEMARFKPGDTIGDFDFARGAEYDACAEAAQDSILIVFPGSGLTIDCLTRKDPAAICNILLNAIVMMTHRIKKTNKLVLENMSWVQELHRRAYEDPGTGLWKQTLIADEIIGSLKEPAALIMLKPDRFKILVDSRGHGAGDEAMIRIAIILKSVTRIIGHGWPMRFKSNEVGLIINYCDATQAQNISETLAKEIGIMEPVPALGEDPQFNFSTTISWSIWPKDGEDWQDLFQGTYANLLETWKICGASGKNTISHYSGQSP